MSAAEHAREALARCEGRLTWMQAVVIACAEHDGVPLDPFTSDDASVVLRSDLLIGEGRGVREAIATARDELRESLRVRENGNEPATGREAWCARHEKRTRVSSRGAGLVHLACGCHRVEGHG